MKGRMQKIPMSIDSRPQKDSTACESYEGVQTFMDMTENNLKEVQFCKLSVIMAVVEWTDCQPRNWETI